MGDVIHGACLCGGVEFEVQASERFGAVNAMGECHCMRCRRWSGGPTYAFVLVEPDHFNVTQGQELLEHWQREGWSERVFCGRCGSGVYSTSDQSMYYVSAGILQDLALSPAYHVNVAFKASWHEIGGAAPQFDELPAAGG